MATISEIEKIIDQTFDISNNKEFKRFLHDTNGHYRDGIISQRTYWNIVKVLFYFKNQMDSIEIREVIVS